MSYKLINSVGRGTRRMCWDASPVRVRRPLHRQPPRALREGRGSSRFWGGAVPIRGWTTPTVPQGPWLGPGGRKRRSVGTVPPTTVATDGAIVPTPSSSCVDA